MSAMREPAAPSPGSEIPGDVHRALADVNVPAYVVDRFGVIRWINSATKKLVGDVRGRQQSSVVAPDGKRVQVEISSCALHEGHRIVGVFGMVVNRVKTAPPAPHPHLTPRQNQVLHLLAHGHSTHQIAAELHLSVDTVRNHIRRMLRALGVHSRIEALAVAHREGILRRDD
jgi:DNA-binding CsgD family transcriptional regulator